MNEGTPGTFAYVALMLWVPIAIGAFFLMRPQRATIFALLGALLFLPEGIDFKFPYLPPLTKQNIPYLCVLVGALLRRPNRVLRLPKERWVILLALALLLGSVGTAFTNPDPLRYGTFKHIVLRGLNVKDGLYTGVDQFLHAALPLFLGLSLFRTAKDLRNLWTSIAAAGLLYVPFALIEMRMSPQFHNWVYGYQQHSFLQTMRWGGYRPMVFMSHGLALARFFLAGMLGAIVGSARGRTILGMPGALVSGILFVTLILCKSTGAIAYAFIGLLVLWVGNRVFRQMVALAFATIVMLYPLLRAADLFPVGKMLAAAGMLDADRQQSLLFRFENEDALLGKARERILFGWGEFNRSAIFDDMARPFSVTDGHWIVLLGIAGAVGFVAAFGMLLAPIVVAGHRLRYIPKASDRLLISGTSFILALLAIDLIPNALWADYPYFIGGALLGVSRTLAFAPSEPSLRRAQVLSREHAHRYTYSTKNAESGFSATGNASSVR
jgi:hypothetical protein